MQVRFSFECDTSPLNHSISASRRLRPVNVFLCRHLGHHHSRHFRIKPADAVSANYKVGRIENMASDEIEHRSIDPKSLRLHQIENEFRRAIAAFVHNSDGRVEAIGNGRYPNFAFERRIGVIQYRVDRMRRVAITG
jgi:hypothetical protein